MKDLLEVYVVAATCMMTVLIIGNYYEKLVREPKVETVECSYEIRDIARKLNVTVVGKCEVTR